MKRFATILLLIALMILSLSSVAFYNPMRKLGINIDIPLENLQVNGTVRIDQNTITTNRPTVRLSQSNPSGEATVGFSINDTNMWWIGRNQDDTELSVGLSVDLSVVNTLYGFTTNSFRPRVDFTRDLGEVGRRWKVIYGSSLDLTNATFRGSSILMANLASNAAPVNTLGQLADGSVVKIANGGGSGSGGTNSLFFTNNVVAGSFGSLEITNGSNTTVSAIVDSGKVIFQVQATSSGGAGTNSVVQTNNVTVAAGISTFDFTNGLNTVVNGISSNGKVIISFNSSTNFVVTAHGNITLTNTISLLASNLNSSSSATNFTLDFAYGRRNVDMTNDCHISAISNAGSLAAPLSVIWRFQNFSGSEYTVSCDSTIKRIGTNFVNVANGQELIMWADSNGSSLTNTIINFALVDSPSE